MKKLLYSSVWKVAILALVILGCLAVHKYWPGRDPYSQKLLFTFNKISLADLLGMRVDDVDGMTRSALTDEVYYFNKVSKIAGKQMLEVDIMDVKIERPSRFILQDDEDRCPKIKLYVSFNGCGFVVLNAVFNSRFLKVAEENLKDYRGDIEFAQFFQKMQGCYSRLIDSKNHKDYMYRGHAYSEKELIVLKSYVPICDILAKLTLGNAKRTLKEKAHILNEKQKERLRNIIERNTRNKDITADCWPFIYADYLFEIRKWKIYQSHIPWFLSLSVSFLFLLFFFWHFLRRSFWQAMPKKLYELGISFDLRIFFRLTKNNWKIILLPPGKQRVNAIVDAECEKFKEKINREVFAERAKNVWEEIERLLSSDDSSRGFLRRYLENVTGEKSKNLSIERVRNNLIKLQLNLEKIKNGSKVEMGSAQTSGELAVICKEKTCPQPVDKGYKEQLLETCLRMLPQNVSVELGGWSINNLECLLVSLMILPKIHPEAVRRLLSRSDLKEILQRRNPFINAIEAGDEKIIFDRLNISLDLDHGKVAKGKVNLRLPSDLQVVVVGTGVASKKCEVFEQAVVDLGAKFNRFANAKNPREIQNALNSVKASKGNTLVVIMATHTKHTATRSFDGIDNRVFVNSLSRDRFKRELVKGFRSL